MDLKKLAPWNWFKKEQEQEQHNEIHRLFERAFRGFGLPSFRLDRDLFPDIQADWLKPMLDIRATENEYSIAVELPGVEVNEVKLELVNDTLKVSGEKRQEKDEKENDFYRYVRSCELCAPRLVRMVHKTNFPETSWFGIATKTIQVPIHVNQFSPKIGIDGIDFAFFRRAAIGNL